MAKDLTAIELYMRQSEFMWRFQQTVALVEAGVFSGWYVLYKDQYPFLAIALLTVGIVILIILTLIIHRTSQYLNAFRKQALEELPESLPKPVLRIKSYLIAVAIPLLLIIFNFLLAIWQLNGKP